MRKPKSHIIIIIINCLFLVNNLLHSTAKIIYSMENFPKNKNTIFGLENFKSFKKLQEIEIAPITLIYGQNSGGKSSLLSKL